MVCEGRPSLGLPAIHMDVPYCTVVVQLYNTVHPYVPLYRGGYPLDPSNNPIDSKRTATSWSASRISNQAPICCCTSLHLWINDWVIHNLCTQTHISLLKWPQRTGSSYRQRSGICLIDFNWNSFAKIPLPTERADIYSIFLPSIAPLNLWAGPVVGTHSLGERQSSTFQSTRKSAGPLRTTSGSLFAAVLNKRR